MTQAFENYLLYHKRVSIHTLTAYKNDLAQFSDFLAHVYHINTLQEAETVHLRDWIIRLIQQGLTNTSVKRKAACLKSYYRFLLKNNQIKINPAAPLKTPKLPKRLPAFISESEMHTLSENAPFDESTFEGVRNFLIIELLYGTGMRLSELINITTRDVSIHESTIKIIGKGNKQRVVPLHTGLKEWINKYNHLRSISFNENTSHNSDYWLLTLKGQKLYPVLVQRMVKDYLSMAASVEKKSPHVLRHTFATHMLNCGAGLAEIKDILGHSSLAATQIYTHNSIEKLKSIFKKAHPKA